MVTADRETSMIDAVWLKIFGILPLVDAAAMLYVDREPSMLDAVQMQMKIFGIFPRADAESVNRIRPNVAT